MKINAPTEVLGLLDKITESFKQLLGDSLVGIYLHGSIAMNCFNPGLSDIDFIVVTSGKLNLEERKSIANLMVKLNEKAPPKGLEMSVVTLQASYNFEHPTPFEFHFSNDWVEKFKNSTIDLTQDRKDPDLAGHFTIIKHRGVVLFGKPIEEVFGEVPSEYYKDSIVADAKDILENMSSNPVYNVLNLCRVWTYVQEGLITSKREGGEWALQYVNESQKDIIQQALDEYKTGVKSKWNKDKLSRFRTSFQNIII